MKEWTFRLRDVSVAIILLLALSPLLVLIIILLGCTQQRVFFCQYRPGKNERLFRMIKFSTLKDVTAGQSEEINQIERLTFIGKYLRKISLDEVPQLWNVIEGNMALVGPRPLLPEYLPLYTKEERLRHSILPGITGWAQVNGRNQLSFKERFRLDRWYVQNRSHLLDAKILWITMKKVIKREGVYANEKTTSARFNGNN